MFSSPTPPFSLPLDLLLSSLFPFPASQVCVCLCVRVCVCVIERVRERKRKREQSRPDGETHRRDRPEDWWLAKNTCFFLGFFFRQCYVVVIAESYKLKLATVDLSCVFSDVFYSAPAHTLTACLLYALTTANGHLCLCLSFPSNIWLSLCLDKLLPRHTWEVLFHFLSAFGSSSPLLILSTLAFGWTPPPAMVPFRILLYETCHALCYMSHLGAFKHTLSINCLWELPFGLTVVTKV